MTSGRRQLLVASAVAIFSTAAALSVELFSREFWRTRAPLVPFVLAVIVTAAFGRLWPTLLTVALGAVSIAYFVLAPHGSLLVAHPGDRALLLLFVGASGLILGANARVRRALEQNRAAAALRETQSRLHRLWESAFIGVVYADAHGKLTDANDAFLRMLGYTRQDLGAGRVRWHELTPPEYASLDARGIAQSREHGASAPYEKVYVGSDGRRVPALLGYARLEGSSPSFISFVLDLSALKRAEGALADQLRLTRIITENATAALFMADARGRCTFMNPAAEAITGFSFDELEGRPLHEAIHHHQPDGQAYPFAECPLGQALSTNASVRSPEELFIRKNGEVFPAICVASPVRQAQALIAAIMEIYDITDRKRMERERELLLDGERAARAEAERANRMKDDFVGMVSHELRTPLNAILGWARLLQREGVPPEQLTRGLAVVERNTRLLEQIVSDLLDVNRITQGKIRIDRTNVDLRPLVNAVLEGERATAEAKGVSIHGEVTATEGRVLGDPVRLQQVLWNLFSNAIKFTPKGGRVDLTLADAPGRLVLTVRDTGQGIAPDFLSHVFDRFRQADTSAARRHGGLGLGLTIVKHIVEIHGGTVRAESDGPGKGASFVVELPSAEWLPDQPSEPQPEHDLTGMTVLVVDDDPDARELAQRILEGKGAEVILAASGPEALAALAKRRPDVVLSDIGMPGMDGYELARRVLDGQALSAARVPLIALTAFVRPEDRERALAAGFRAHLTKPLDPRVVVETVAGLAGGADRGSCSTPRSSSP